MEEKHKDAGSLFFPPPPSAAWPPQWKRRFLCSSLANSRLRCYHASLLLTSMETWFHLQCPLRLPLPTCLCPHSCFGADGAQKNFPLLCVRWHVLALCQPVMWLVHGETLLVNTRWFDEEGGAAVRRLHKTVRPDPSAAALLLPFLLHHWSWWCLSSCANELQDSAMGLAGSQPCWACRVCAICLLSQVVFFFIDTIFNVQSVKSDPGGLNRANTSRVSPQRVCFELNEQVIRRKLTTRTIQLHVSGGRIDLNINDDGQTSSSYWRLTAAL